MQGPGLGLQARSRAEAGGKWSPILEGQVQLLSAKA